MSHQRLQERVHAALSRAADEPPAASPQPPRAGELFVLEATAEQPVEWVLIDHQGEGGRPRVVAADTGPLAGRADVAVIDEETVGPLVLRCGRLLTVRPELLDPQRRTGELPPRILELARERLRQLDEGDHPATSDELEAEGDPEYRLWQEGTLEPAYRALTAASAQATPAQEPEPEPARVLPFPNTWRHPLALAATVLLVVSLALAGGLFRQQGQLTELAETVRRQSTAQQQAEEDHRRQLEGLQQDHAAVEGALRTQVSELERRLEEASTPQPPPRPLVALAQAWLVPATRRGAAQEIDVPPVAQHLLVMLQLKPHQSFQDFPAYRLEIWDPYSETRIWSGPLTNPDGPELPVVLPRDLLDVGEYRLELLGLRDGETTAVATYRIELAFE